MTDYALHATTELPGGGEEIMRWLTNPELMRKWMLGISSIEADGDRVRVEVIHGGHAGWSFVGEIVEQATNRLVRRYGLASGDGDYARTVTYELGNTDPVALEVSVTTAIPGLAEVAARMGAKAEQKALERSLRRLRAEIEGAGGGFFARLRGSGGSVGPL
jgi:hypothetical protein